MGLKGFKMPFLVTRTCPEPSIFAYQRPISDKVACSRGRLHVVDKLPHLLSTKIRGAVCPRIFIGSVVGGKFGAQFVR